MNNYWNKYYKQSKSPDKPTSFSIFCTKFLNNFSGVIYDLGCGNGRDTFFFNKIKHNCIGVDSCPIIITKNKKKNKLLVKNFIKSDFTKLNFIEKKKEIVLYSRFSLHSINQKKHKIFFKKIHKIKNIKFVMIEVRTIYDELCGKGKKISKYEYVNTHYRRFIDPKIIKKDILRSFKIKYFKVSKNFAKFYKENPKVLRVIAHRS
jgi:tellurite methyltransferase